MIVEKCNAMKIKLVGVGAKDIAEGNKKGILAIVWQLVRQDRKSTRLNSSHT
mgnify:CR=1 FL=1